MLIYKNLAYQIQKERQQLWGNEISILIFDSLQPITDKNDSDFEFGFRYLDTLILSSPNSKEIEALALQAIITFEAREDTPLEVIMTEREVVDLLIEKGYLQLGDSLSDLGAKDGK